MLALKYAELVYFGLWFTPLREALDAFFTKATENVTGAVKMALYKGNISYIGRASSPVSLYQCRSVVVHHGRELRPEGRGGIHKYSWAAGPRARAGDGGAEGKGAREVSEQQAKTKQAAGGKMWSGRFREPLDAVFEQWQRSFPFDVRLLPQEVAASKAHARMIAAAGILTDAELERMIDGLDQVGDISPEFTPVEPGFVNPRLLGAELGTTPRSIRRWLSRQPEFCEDHVKHTRIVLAKNDPLLLRMKSHFAIQANLDLDGEGACEEFSATTEADLAASMAHAEDIHHFVELQLTEVIGPLALKLHTGRSRNEQIATDMRLFVREAFDATA